MTFPIEDLLKKQREPHEEKESQKEFVESTADDTAEEEELEAVEFLEDSEDESVTEDGTISQSEDDELFVEKEPDAFALEEVAEEIDDIGLEHEFSFRDIWDEQDADLSEEEFEQEGIEEDVKIVKEEVTIDQKKIEEDLDSPIKSSVDIDDILEGSEEDDISDDFGFEMLTDEMSFKNEIFFEGNSENGSGSTKDKNIKPSVTESLSEELISNNLQEEKEDTGESEIEETKESIPITEIDEDDLLVEDEKYAVTDFSFSDLLEEIESDISFFDENNLDEDEMEYAYEGESQTKDAGRIQESQNLSKSEDGGASRKTGADSLFKSQQHDRLREKHLILGLQFYQERNYKLAVEQFLKVVNIYPDFKEAYSILGNAYYRNNQIEEAIKSYERVKQIDPFDADAYENTGVIFANMGKYEDAIKEWKTLLEFRPDRKDILKHIEKAENLVDK
ncbi:MAG: tetratricopeptide repeat protein [Candidatus Hodarchaeota archaeon]